MRECPALRPIGGRDPQGLQSQQGDKPDEEDQDGRADPFIHASGSEKVYQRYKKIEDSDRFTSFYNPRITLVELKHCNFNARIQKILIMKKIKILLGVLLVSVAVLCCLLIRAETSSELLDWNIEALSQSESEGLDCVGIPGGCVMQDGKINMGMKLAD